MPSVGTRKSARVLGARVLRSGKRILIEFREKGKNVREAYGKNKWVELRDDSADGGRNGNDIVENSVLNNDTATCNVDERNSKGSVQEGATVEDNGTDRRWGIVYRRKRKRTESVAEVCHDIRSGSKLRKRRRSRKHEATEGFEISPEIAVSDIGVLTSCNGNVEHQDSHKASMPLKKYALRSLRSGNSRNIQKRGVFPRKKIGVQARNAGKLASKSVKIRRRGGRLSAIAPTHVLCKSSTANTKEQSSPLGISTWDSSCCVANLLIIEADKCYREVGATVSLEFLDSRQWVLLVTKNGENLYNLKAEKTMGSCTRNRYTRSTIWAADYRRKLEFPSKTDWLTFKELYKKCFDRNMQEPEASDVPVPSVREVEDPSYVPYVRPETYITVKDDELTRALSKKNAIYDMDSDDEEWLTQFNNEVTPESFELVVDALEKGYYCKPNEEASSSSSVHSERRDVIEDIRSYWTTKRKQNCSTLVRIFKLYQPRRDLIIPNSVLRKKRTLKRQGSSSSFGRGKQRTFLKDTAFGRQMSLEHRDNEEKLRQANADLQMSEKLAILKRERAQKLMQNVNLATYKAMMALKIAEEAQSLNK